MTSRRHSGVQGTGRAATLSRHSADNRAVAPQRLAAAGEAASAPRWRWDYFVRNLLGAEPPQEYEIGKRNPPAP